MLKNKSIKNYKLKPIKSDASFRKYYRVKSINNEKKTILVDSPKKTENNLGYLRASKIFKEMNLSVPKIFDFNISKGYFLIEDFGVNTYTNALKRGMNEDKLYNLATNVLIHINKRSKHFLNQLPKYTHKKLIDEASLFILWYWPAIFNKKPKKKIVKEFIHIWKNILKRNLTSKKVVVHRDFHIDNLFFLKNRKSLNACGLIDFQDAVIGPASYDLVSLLEDARRDVNSRVIVKTYNKFVKGFDEKNKKNFRREYKVLAANRHLKVIGIFTRLFVRDKKKIYLKNIPRLWKLLENNLNDHLLFELKQWIDKYFPKRVRIKPKI